MSNTIVKQLTLFFFGSLVVMLSLGQVERVQVTSHVAVYAHDVLLAVWCSVFFLLNRDVRAQILAILKRRNLSEGLFLLWAVVGIVTAVVLHRDVTYAVLYWARMTLYLFFVLTLAASVRLRYLERQTVFFGVLFAGLMILVLGLLQYFFLPDMRFLFFLGWDDHYYRLISTILDPGFTGILLVLTLFTVQTLPTTTQWNDVAKKITSFLLLIGILLTYSRASYLACAAGLVIASATMAVRKKWRVSRMSVVYLLFFLACIPLLPRQGGEGVRLERLSTVTARTATFTSEIESMQPLDWTLGHGLFISPFPATSAFQTAFDLPSHANLPDSWFVLILFGTGILGLLLFLIVIGQNLWTMWRMNLWFFVSGVAVLLHGLFNASLFYPFVILFLGLFAVSLGKIDR